MNRVVLDPGVLVSALLSPHGSPAELFRAWRDGAIELIVSPALLDEVATAIARPKFRPYATPAEAEAFVAVLRREALAVEDPPAPPGLTADPGDDYLVALAHAARARFLVSGDSHLTTLQHQDPPVLTPRQLVDRLRNR